MVSKQSGLLVKSRRLASAYSLKCVLAVPVVVEDDLSDEEGLVQQPPVDNGPVPMEHDAGQQPGQGAGGGGPPPAADVPVGAGAAPGPQPAGVGGADLPVLDLPPDVAAALAAMAPPLRDALVRQIAAAGAQQATRHLAQVRQNAQMAQAQAGINVGNPRGTGGAGPSGAGPSSARQQQAPGPAQPSATNPGNVPALAPVFGPVALPFPAGVAPKALPKPEKWSGAAGGMRGVVWLASYEAYCYFCAWDPAAALTAFLTGKAMEWWYSLQASAPPTQPLTWPAVRTEFLSYFDPQRRTMQSEALHQLMIHKCTMAQHPTVKVYEQEFKRLVREAGPVSAHVQIAWFVAGLTTDMKRQCATQPNGSEWQSLDALIQFALGVETRNEIADAPLAAPAKRPRLSAASMPASKQGRAKSSPTPKGQPSKPKGTQKAKKGDGDSIPGRLKGLWAATQKRGWKDEGNIPYTEERWLAVVRGGKCVICRRPRGVGPDCCPGHPRPGGNGGGNAAAA